MKDVLIACETMKEEINGILKSCNKTYDQIRWIRSGLHNVSQTLRKTIQDELDQISCAEHVILGFGACGNAVADLNTGNYRLVIPRIDDCISLMLGSYKRKQEVLCKGQTYFLTYGWLHNDIGIHEEYTACVEKYGKETADMVYQQIIGGYQYLGVMDTGVENLDSLLAEAAPIASDLKLEEIPIRGDLSMLRALITGPWGNDPRFILLEPNQNVDIDILRFPV